MILFLHRWGILTIPLILAALLLTQSIVDALWGNGFYAAHYWPKDTSAAVAAALGGVVGYSMNRKHETWATMHRFFFLPMEYWAGIILFITACISYGQLTGAH